MEVKTQEAVITEAGETLKKVVSTAGDTRKSWPSHFEGTIRIPCGHELAPESSVCIYWIGIDSAILNIYGNKTKPLPTRKTQQMLIPKFSHLRNIEWECIYVGIVHWRQVVVIDFLEHFSEKYTVLYCVSRISALLLSKLLVVGQILCAPFLFQAVQCMYVFTGGCSVASGIICVYKIRIYLPLMSLRWWTNEMQSRNTFAAAFVFSLSSHPR